MVVRRTLALFLAAIDDRVRATVASCYRSSWRAAHSVPWNMCGSQVLFGTLGHLEHVDLGALVAPRPLCIESATDDFAFPLTEATAQVEVLRRIYEGFGAAAHTVEHDVFPGGHAWHGKQSIAFLEHAL